MNKILIFGGVLLGLVIEVASGASQTEYTEFLESKGAIVLETYRAPEGSDLSYWGTNTDTYSYKTLDSDGDRKAPYWTKGDFNNDSKPDYLYILFHRKHDKAWLIGFMSSSERYRPISIEPSDKTMAIETIEGLARHFHLEGHGHALSWDKTEGNFDVIQ